MFDKNVWWDQVLDSCFRGRLDAERIAAQLEEALDRSEDVQPPSATVEFSLDYVKKALELSRLLAAELYEVAKSRKRHARSVSGNG